MLWFTWNQPITYLFPCAIPSKARCRTWRAFCQDHCTKSGYSSSTCCFLYIFLRADSSRIYHWSWLRFPKNLERSCRWCYWCRWGSSVQTTSWCNFSNSIFILDCWMISDEKLVSLVFFHWYYFAWRWLMWFIFACWHFFEATASYFQSKSAYRLFSLGTLGRQCTNPWCWALQWCCINCIRSTYSFAQLSPTAFLFPIWFPLRSQ